MSSRFHVDPSETVDIFEFDPDDVISATPPNVITIRARMSVEIAGRVSSELVQLGTDSKLEAHLGAHVGALLLHNILAWRGPDFDALPCTPTNIRALPSPESDPFIEKVANAIGERNRKPQSPNAPSPATRSTSASAGAAGSIEPPGGQPSNLLLASGMSPLRSHINSAGFQKKSEDSTPIS